MPARELDLHQDVLREPRLMAAVTHPYAVWLFSIAGDAILWANAAGAPFAAAYQRGSEAGSQVRQVAGKLPAGQPRLERLRGFGGPLGRLLTCMCTRLTLANGTAGLLVTALDPIGPQIPLEERLRLSIANGGASLAAFSASGEWLGGQPDGSSLFRAGVSLPALGLNILRQDALKQGYATALTPSHRVHIFRAGEGHAAGLIAEAVPLFAAAAPTPMPVPPSTPAPAPTPAASFTPAPAPAPATLPAQDAGTDQHATKPLAPPPPLAPSPLAPPPPAAPPVHVAAPLATPAATSEATEPAAPVTPHKQPSAAPVSAHEPSLREALTTEALTTEASARQPSAPETIDLARAQSDRAEPPQRTETQTADTQAADDAAASWEDIAEPDSQTDSHVGNDFPEHAFSPPPLPRAFSGPVAVTPAPASRAASVTASDPHTNDHDASEHDINDLNAGDLNVSDLGPGDFPAVEDAPLVTPEPHQPEPASSSEADGGKPALPFDMTLPTERRYPLRFMWQMSADGHFMLGSDEFLRLIGMQTATTLGRTWTDINNTLSLDPYDHVARAIATRETWSGIVVRWPLDGSGERLAVELSGLPLFDHNRHYLGYRGFGVCRDLDGLERIARLRGDQGTAPAAARHEDARTAPLATADIPAHGTAQPAPASNVTHLPTALHYPPAPNVLPFRILGETKGPLLTPVENNAFNELARQLTERLNANDDKSAAHDAPPPKAAPGTSAAADAPAADEAPPAHDSPVSASAHADAACAHETHNHVSHSHDVIAVASAPEHDGAQNDHAPFGHAPIERPLLDRMPVGVLIYRLDRLLYANRLFLEHSGFDSLEALAEAGGLDALFVTPDHSRGSLDISGGDEGTPLTIATATGDRLPVAARLFTVPWGSETAMALVFARHALNGAQTAADAPTQPAATIAAPAPAMTPPASPTPAPAMPDESTALRAVLDGISDAVLILDREARIVTLNRAASALFDDARRELEGRTLADVIAPESQKIALGYFDNLDRPDVTNLMNHPREANGRDNPGRDIRARTRDNRILPLALTMARAGDSGDRFYAIFREGSRPRPATDIQAAARASERAANEKAGLLARISQEIRAPLNAIIGFADVMIGEKFGPPGNERYADYLKDIRQSGEHVVTLIDNLVNLTHIQSGKVTFTFANINLNELIEHCVAIMQPQANRERIIIRTSLAHSLPPVHADARALRQIALNLITHSIRLAQAGGQVIVSTALSDNGDVTLRVRNTGAGMSEAQIEAALEPFAAAGQPGTTPDLDLSLTKALSEANHARFAITSNGQQQGTLVEVTFPRIEARTG